MTVPAGTLIALSGTIHFDEDIYPNSTDFEPFRFLQKPDKREETWRQQLFVTPSPEYCEIRRFYVRAYLTGRDSAIWTW